MVHRQIGQHLAVQVYTGFLELAHELRVRQAILADTGVDSLDPYPSEFPLFLLAVPVGIYQSFFDGIFGYGPDILLAAKESFGQLHDSLTFSPRGYVVY